MALWWHGEPLSQTKELEDLFYTMFTDDWKVDHRKGGF